jgi:hypothetical protein
MPVIALSVMSFIRSMQLNDITWDDNCWILSSYFTNSLEEFLHTGFYELRRIPLGTSLYYYFSLHKLTDYSYLIWNSINMTVQVLSPVLLYIFINNLFKKRLLAFFIAASFTVCVLDNTLPYYSSTVYRAGTLLSITSFLLTERALVRETRWGLMLIAVLLSAFSSYVLMETTVALEPARLFLIVYLLSGKRYDRKTLTKKSVGFWLPFVIITIPLLIYKLMNKPYGLYNSMYSIDPLFFLNFKLHAKAIRHLMFYNWFNLTVLSGSASLWSGVLGVLAVIASLLMMKSPGFSTTGESCPEPASFKITFSWYWKEVSIAFIFGLLLIIPAISMCELAGRSPAPGMEGRHATIILFGYAMSFGSLLYCTYASIRKNSRWATVLIILFLGAGVFFHNMNLDVYSKGQECQRRFWKAFTKRFPSLPLKASFLMDVRGDDHYYYYADLEAYYELELPLNMLYARSKLPKEFLNYRVYAISEGIKDEWKKSSNITFQRVSHAGQDTFDSQELIIVHYRGGNILVNREILRQYPDVPYRMWLDKDPPEFGGTVPAYPLRYKFQGFY